MKTVSATLFVQKVEEGLSSEQLAKEFGISKSMVSKFRKELNLPVTRNKVKLVNDLSPAKAEDYQYAVPGGESYTSTPTVPESTEVTE